MNNQANEPMDEDTAMDNQRNKEEQLTTVRDIPCPYEKISVDDLVERYNSLYTGAVIDIFQEMEYHNQWLGRECKCVTRTLQREAVAGFAFTVQWISDPQPDERERPAARMVGSYPKNSMIVVDTGADQVSGFWGELATTTCVNNGVRGAVINGGAKDVGFVRKMDFPIFAKFTSPVDGFYHSRLRGWQLPIWWNDILVRPWDMLLADADGVLVIPYEIAEQVLESTEKRSQSEDQTRSLLVGGADPVKASEDTGRKDL